MYKYSKLIKFALSSSFVIIAATCAITNDSFYPLFILAGALLCWHGDMTLSRIGIFDKIYTQHFLIGMLSFVLGHSAYALAFNYKMSKEGSISFPILIITFLFYSAVTVLLWKIFIWRGDTPPPMRYAALTYALVISYSASSALTLFVVYKGFWIMPAIGGVLFMFSDFLIGANNFGKRKIPRFEFWVWATYSVAQFLIVSVPVFTRV